MRYVYSVLFGLALGASSVFVHNFYSPIGLLLSIAATFLGIWAAGRLWGRRIYKVAAAAAWAVVVLRAVYPGINNEFLILGNTNGVSLVNFGFIALVIAILAPL